MGVNIYRCIGVGTTQLDFLGSQPQTRYIGLEYRCFYDLVQTGGCPEVCRYTVHIRNDLAVCLLLSFNVDFNKVRSQIVLPRLPIRFVLLVVAEDPH